MRRKNNNFLTGVIVPLFLLVILIASQSAVVNAQSAETVSKQVEEAVLAEDWGKVAKLLDLVTPETPSPVLRMIKGHADLALNRNNESLCLFLSVSSADDFNKWDEWSANFSENNSKSAIANYFKGDSLARLEKWDSALISFNKAHDIRPKHPMVLNARGAVYAAKGKWDDALLDLSKSAMLNKNFADAYASLGAMWIQRRTGAKGAYKAFYHAIELSPNFALAFNGRGSANFALANWDDAQKDFEDAGKKTHCLPIAHINMNALMLAKIDYLEKESEMLAMNNPGMETQVKIKSLQNTIRSSKMKVVRDIAMQTFTGTVKDLGATGKVFADVAMGTKMRGMPSVTAKAGGEIKFKPDFKGAHDYTTKWTNSDMRHQYGQIQAAELKITQLRQQQSYNPSGVKTDLRQAFIDSGNWPVDTFYGLFYIVEPVTSKGSDTK